MEGAKYWTCICGSADHFVHIGFSTDSEWPYCTVSVGINPGRGWRNRVRAVWRLVRGEYAECQWIEVRAEQATEMAGWLLEYAAASVEHMPGEGNP